MNLNDAIKNIQENPELEASLKDAFARNAGFDEVAAILTDAGVDAEDAEALVAEYQRKRGGTIAVQELDSDELEKVAGGTTVGDVKDSCSGQFNYNGYNRLMEVCTASQYCDDYFECNSQIF